MKTRVWLFAFLFTGLWLLPGIVIVLWQSAQPVAAQGPGGIQGPFVGPAIKASSWDGDVRSLPVVNGWNPGALSPSVPSPSLNYDGILNSTVGKPDANGDVGTNYYIQATNMSAPAPIHTAFWIFNKQGQAYTMGPVSFNALWAGANTGTACDSSNFADPVVLYDHLADRWLLTDLAEGSPSYICIAVSKTNDPVRGGWWFYPIPDTADGCQGYPDYPKVGLWPDAYVMTTNSNYGGNCQNRQGLSVRVWGFQRSAFLSGGLANYIYYDLPTCARTDTLCPFTSLLPGNLRGVSPPSGSPNYLASIESPNISAGVPFSIPFTSSVLHLYKFHPDYNNVSNSYFVSSTLPVPTFTEPVTLTVYQKPSVDTIPQPGVITRLMSLGDRLQPQLQYRDISGTESLWLNHAVSTNPNDPYSPTGIRWYEVRDPNGSPYVYQQGTYDLQDGNSRWMGSLAVDQNGDMALGYNVSSSSLFPAIRYTGRLVSDPPGQLSPGEITLIAGTSDPSDDEWGDYSAMTIDPADGCTFWYTNEYYTQTVAGWHTRIGNFAFCSPGP